MTSFKCIICNVEAKFCIKGRKETYCEECALDQFGDLAYLVKVEDEAQRLKKIVDEKISQIDEVDKDHKDNAERDSA